MAQKRWLLSHLQSLHDRGGAASTRFGSVVYSGEHPVARIKRWAETEGRKNREQSTWETLVPLSFQEVDDSVPEIDTTSPWLRQ